jgi:hypothetical protein
VNAIQLVRRLLPRVLVGAHQPSEMRSDCAPEYSEVRPDRTTAKQFSAELLLQRLDGVRQ